MGEGAAFLLPALAGLGSATTWALGSHLFRRALAQSGDGPVATPAAANLFKNVLAAALFLALLPLTGAAFPPAEAWSGLAFSGLCGFAIGDTLYIAALTRAGVQVAAMVGLVHAPAAALLAWLAYGERVGAWALVGGAAILAGVALVVSEAPREGSRDARSVRVGILFAAIAAVAQAVGVVAGHRAMAGVDVLGGTLARLAGGVAGAFAIAFAAGLVAREGRAPTGVRAEVAQLVRPWLDRSARRGLPIAVLFGALIGLPLFHLALRGLPSTTAAILFATTPLVALPIGLAFGERHGPRATFGALLGLAGVAAVVALPA